VRLNILCERNWEEGNLQENQSGIYGSPDRQAPPLIQTKAKFSTFCGKIYIKQIFMNLTIGLRCQSEEKSEQQSEKYYIAT
jgi:hypothetical protein